MGLDMYLDVSVTPEKNINLQGQTRFNQDDIDLDLERLMYWRKANAIHQWFVTHVQNDEDDGFTYVVMREDLEALHDTIRNVRLNKHKAHEWLPTQSGFFFGSTDYDDYYFDTLKETEQILYDVLQKFADGPAPLFTYTASW